MSPQFAHLHLASGYSLRYGASSPAALVQRAVEQGLDTLALTDRDGCYGVVKFARACLQQGIKPVLGVDLTVLPDLAAAGSLVAAELLTTRRTATMPAKVPTRGGAVVDQRHPRVVLLAKDGRGWAAICRTVSAAHLGAQQRGRPGLALSALAPHAGRGGLVALLGPDSPVGRAVLARRPDLAAAHLRAWRDAVGTDSIAIEVVSHRAGPNDPRTAPWSTMAAARMLVFASEHRVPAVLTNAVRYARPEDGPTVDVLDAVRRLVPLDARHIDRAGEGHLKDTAEMVLIAQEVAHAAGHGLRGAGGRASDAAVADRLLGTTRALADACRVDPEGDLGLGGVHLPEMPVLDSSGRPAGVVLRERCEAGLTWRGMGSNRAALDQLDHELRVIDRLGFPAYFLAVAEVVDLVRARGIRAAARGSGAGSLVNHLLGISGVNPMAHGLLFERFLSESRGALPDIDVDVESARRPEIYEAILGRFGADRVTCVAMTDTYRVRHAIRDVGAALGLPPGEVGAIATSFPHIRASDARRALAELPELAAAGLAGPRLDLLFRLVERLDGLPRHIALHPCGVVISDSALLDRTPVEASWGGFPMSQFDKDDVEDLGLLKLDVLGIRMQSAMAHAVVEIARVDHVDIELDAVALDDPATFALIRSTHTLGCFQIESPGQRELVGKFAPETFHDLVVDISLFRPGPVKSDMVTPFLRARQGWQEPQYLHPDLEPVLHETCGVVVFHEQVIRIVAVMTGCTLAAADEARRALGGHDSQPQVREWFYPKALGLGYELAVVDRVWEVLRAFASFGFCKAHAAAFALPTYQSAWLKAHYPAHFLAGVLTHDPGMYPRRLILDDARQMGIAVLPLDVNRSDTMYRVEQVGMLDEPPPGILGSPPRHAPDVPGVPDGRAYGIRLSLADVAGISDAEALRIVGNRPFHSLADFSHRAVVSRPVTERLVMAGGFDSLYGLDLPAPVRRRGRVTRRDLLLQVAELDRWHAGSRGSRAGRPRARGGAAVERDAIVEAAAERGDLVRQAAARQARGTPGLAPPGSVPGRSDIPAAPVSTQLALDLAGGVTADVPISSGLPEFTAAEKVRAELEILGMDTSRHVMDFYRPLLQVLRTTRSADLISQRAKAEVLVAGVKVATQTPPVRSGRRVVFLTLDDGHGPVDATFFEDAQGPYAATLFHSWLLVVRGELRRTGPRGVSLRATGCWALPELQDALERSGPAAVWELVRAVPEGWVAAGDSGVTGAAASRSSRPVMVRPDLASDGRPGSGSDLVPAASNQVPTGDEPGTPIAPERSRAGGMGPARVLVHASGFRQSPYADIKPAGASTKQPPREQPPREQPPREQPPREQPPREQDKSGTKPTAERPSSPRKLWHTSPGSPG